jgi:RHS repeat-associated protein
MQYMYLKDGLQRVITAEYSGTTFFQYTYDAVGNRLSQDNLVGSTFSSLDYTYDFANRLIADDNVEYTWDANGNLLDDGVNTYTYDSANRLVSISGGVATVNYAYRCNGLSRDQWGITGCQGDLVSETLNNVTTTYVLDQAAGLSQVLSDGTNDYVYGLDRIAQTNVSATEYFLGDALGSVRQLADGSGAVTMAMSYDPFGSTGSSLGNATTIYGFTGEQQDSYIKLINLRSRLYSPATGRFLTRDSWQGDYYRPLSLNEWNYVEGNPVNFTDPTGLIRSGYEARIADAFVQELQTKYGVRLLVDWGPSLIPVPTPPSQSPNQANTACDWREGDWTIDELHTLWSGVISLSFLMGGPNKFIANTGGVTVWQGPTKYLGLTHAHNIEFTSFSQTLTRWTVVHEFGHAWDANFNWNWSLKLEDYTGGYTNIIAAEYEWKMGKCDTDKIIYGQRVPGQRLRGCNSAGYFYGGFPPAGSDVNFNRVEDFAESVAAAVYPIEAQEKVHQYQYDKLYKSLFYLDYKKTLRWEFIIGVINGTIK